MNSPATRTTHNTVCASFPQLLEGKVKIDRWVAAPQCWTRGGMALSAEREEDESEIVICMYLDFKWMIWGWTGKQKITGGLWSMMDEVCFETIWVAEGWVSEEDSICWKRVDGNFWVLCMCVYILQVSCHTLSITFRHLPPNYARTGYVTEGAHFISLQLSTDVVSALGKFGY